MNLLSYSKSTIAVFLQIYLSFYDNANFIFTVQMKTKCDFLFVYGFSKYDNNICQQQDGRNNGYPSIKQLDDGCQKNKARADDSNKTLIK
jgi:hypothetical protein